MTARVRHNPSPAELVACTLPTAQGEFRLCALPDPETGLELIALTMGDLGAPAPCLVRLHSECLTGDGFFSQRCDCGAQLKAAMQAIAKEGRGAVIYLRQEGRGIGLINKIRAYALQDAGADTVDANRMLGFADDLRRYDGAAYLLKTLGVTSVRLMTNNPSKISALEDLGIAVTERVELHVGENPHNEHYLQTKIEKMGHLKV